MSTRKVRITASTTTAAGQNANMSASFGGVELVALESVTAAPASPTVFEYTADVPSGSQLLSIAMTNDLAIDNDADGVWDEDVNLQIHRIEVADDGVNYVDVPGTDISTPYVFEGVIDTDNYSGTVEWDQYPITIYAVYDIRVDYTLS